MSRREFLHAFATRLAGASLAVTALAPVRSSAKGAALPPATIDRSAFRKLCADVLAERVSPQERWVKPSALYSSMFLRDSFWILSAFGDRHLAKAVYDRFQAAQAPNGQVPTDLRTDGSAGYHDDDSTLLWVLLAYELARSGSNPDLGALSGALGYLRSRVRGGAYVSAAGRYRYWLDTFSVPAEDVVQYNQGLWAVATRCLRLMGLPVMADEVRGAARHYQPSQLSSALPYRDVSALTGEYLCLHLLGQRLLSDDEVRGAVAGLAPVSYADQRFLGYKVCSDASGTFLPRSLFLDTPMAGPGSYHNGGSWVLYDSLACVVGAWHNLPEQRSQLWARLNSELRLNQSVNEYIVTSSEAGRLGECPPERRGYGWSAYTAVLLDQVEGGPRPTAMLH